ncbi:MAG: hypothetical protein ACK53L_05540, partial [Pirellulaceae bacterium]
YLNMANIGGQGYGTPGKAYYPLQFLNAAAGAATAVAPLFTERKTAALNQGFMASISVNGRYLWKSAFGAYLSLFDRVVVGKSKAFAGNTSNWENTLTIDFGVAFPFGVSVPL